MRSKAEISRRTALQLFGASVVLAACGKGKVTPESEHVATVPSAAPATTAALIDTETPQLEPTGNPSLSPTDQNKEFEKPPEKTPSPAIEAIVIPHNIRENAKEAFMASYDIWKEAYVTERGVNKGELRVMRPEPWYGEAQYGTVSEGIGYGLICAAHSQDWKVFDGLLEYALRNRNGRGLMKWSILENGKIADEAAATDADMDIAYSLIAASKTHLRYGEIAKEWVTNIMTYCVEPQTYILKPGDVWGGSLTGNNAVNVSYFSPAYYRLFQDITQDSRWDLVAKSSKTVLNNCVSRSTAGLVPNFSTVEGTKSELKPDDYYFGYDAVRVPWRQAQAALWYQDEHAYSFLKGFNAFFEKNSVASIVDGYELDGRPRGRVHNSSFIAPVACASVFSLNEAYMIDANNELISIHNHTYYDDSMRILSLLLLSGDMQH